MKRFITHWILISVALALTAWVLPGVHIDSMSALLIGAIILGFLNAVLKPILVLLTLPLTILTLGLFYFILNALLFLLGAGLVQGFAVDGFWWALAAALLMGFISSLIGSLFKSKREGSRAGH